jgi:hypothetical protein
MMRPFVHVSRHALVYTLSSASPCFDERALAAETSRAPGSSLPTYGPDSSRGRYRYRAMDVRPARERCLLRPVRCACGRGGRENALQVQRLVVSRSHALHKETSVLRASSTTDASPSLVRRSPRRSPALSRSHVSWRRPSPSELPPPATPGPPSPPLPRCACPPRPSSGPRGASARVHPHPASPLPYPAPDHFRSSPQPTPFPCAKLRHRPRSRPHLALPRSRACASVHCAVDRLRAG